ncbi:adenylyltransferase and sulfurtransferase MOCS3 [Anabrus simplex]|uniref:adenylyltransferase and sulfurtransferase MOCS3 n=1 Tax=Anabrus simplex TaxID=316456 RepID=UPI0035A2DA74
MSIESLEKDILELRKTLMEKEYILSQLKHNLSRDEEESKNSRSTRLTNHEIARFSRQIIMPEVGVTGQLALKNSSVLIVGAGGLGCPSALYLAGAGIGRIGIVDYDEVEVNNLHRQLLHSETSIGQSKVHSAAQALRRLYSGLQVIPYHLQLDSTNALDIVKQFDMVLDATDNVATRYLLNDACVLTKRPLISGSALQYEGQLTVYNYEDGPCYRCLFPVPPPPETVTNCGDGGVLGVVPGVIGTLQALQVINIVLKCPGILSGSLLLFDGSDLKFRTVRLRARDPNCSVCGENPTVSALIDYEQFCGARANDKDHSVQLLDASQRISASDYKDINNNDIPHILIDVRSPMEFEICHLDGSLNIPLASLAKEECVQKLKEVIKERRNMKESDFPVYTICRRGNDSQKAAVKLMEHLSDTGVQVKDIKGGLHSWAETVDQTFPVY